MYTRNDTTNNYHTHHIHRRLGALGLEGRRSGIVGGAQLDPTPCDYIK